MKKNLPLVLLLLCSCARTDFVKAPEIFRPLPAEATLQQRQDYFEKQKVHVLGGNHAQVGGQDYNAAEMLRYYDDAKNLDSSKFIESAKAKVLKADDWAFFSTAYGSIAGAVIGGIRAYLATPNYDFQALNSIPGGALPGLGWGMLAGMAVGWAGFAIERSSAENDQREAAGEFNRMARTLLKLEAAPMKDGAKAGIALEY